jgi:amino acid transporter
MNARSELVTLPSADARTRILGLVPMVLFSVSAMITLDSVATVAASGWRGITVFTVLAIVFYAPYGFITAELGSAWPQEGGIYVWIREAYGERVGGVCAWFYWVNLAYWAPAVFVIFAGTVRSAFWPGMSRTWEELIVIGLLWLVVAIGILPLRLTTWVNNASAAAKIAVLLAAALVGLVFALRHGIANPVSAG